MATFDGARHLPAQLDSLLAQSHDNWSLMVSDDGSRDATAQVLHAFDRAHPGRITRLMMGPGGGSAVQNFMTLLLQHDVPRGLVALADQDDVWLPQKLARAVHHLEQTPADLPAIYGANSIVTDARLRPLRGATARTSLPGFRNALVQNIFSGHTTVLNRAAICLVQQAGMPGHIAFHDWWIYQLVSGAGGHCLLDRAATVLYRQHHSNAFGAACGVKGAVRRIRHLMRDDYAGWLCAHWRALSEVAHLLTHDARDVVGDLMQRRRNESRGAQLRRLHLHRSSAGGTAALWLAAGLGRI